MQNKIFWNHSESDNSGGLLKRMHNVQVHSLFSHAIIALLSMMVIVLVSILTVEVNVANDAITFEVRYKTSHADQLSWNLRDMKSVDVMKFTKDTMRNQPSDAEITNVVNTLADGLAITHIAQSIPLDSSEDYNAQNTPSPRTATVFTQTWSDAIHTKGLHVIWRGTWSGIEGIYDFPKHVGPQRFPAGTAASAATDGNTTWLGKTYLYIVNHPSFFQDGDIWAVMPERTEGIFQDSTSFLPATGGIQKNYAQFFNDLKTVSDAAFARIGKNVITGMTANNFSELNSGWMYSSVPNAANITVVDHYGITHTPQEMEADLRHIYNTYHRQVYLQEWGDYWNAQLSTTDRTQYLRAMYQVLQSLTDDHVLAGFNYWGGWANDQEGILQKVNGSYSLNYRGALLGGFFANNPTRIVTLAQPIVQASVDATPTPAAVTPEPVTADFDDSNADALSDPTPTPSPTISSFSPAPTPDPTPISITSPQPTPTSQPVAAPEIAEQHTQGTSYKTGTLVNDHGTVYLIDTDKKIPFTNYPAFKGLGYSQGNVVKGDSSNYNASETYALSSAGQAHPWHSWVLYGKVIYYVHSSGLIGVPSLKVFLNNGGDMKMILKANKEDVKILNANKLLPILKMDDPRINN